MGVEYNANYGIGYKVYESDVLTEEGWLEYGLSEYIETEEGEGFESFQVENAWTGNQDGVYLVLTDPFSYGLDLTKCKELLDSEVRRLQLEVEGEFGLVGGLYIS